MQEDPAALQAGWIYRFQTNRSPHKMQGSMLTDALKTAYRSERLHYMRINQGDGRVRTLLLELFQDARVHALTTTMLLRPMGQRELDYLMGEYSNALLGVAICLLPSEVERTSQQADGNDKPIMPIMIGELVIGEGGMPGAIAHNRNASIGMAISSRYQGKGYGREALDWAADWAFRHGNLHSVSISTAAFNTRAAKLYRDAGFVEEGRRRQVIWLDRAWHDELLFSMTEEEWEAVRGKAAAMVE
jgi:RimJ/RimL family protein N-acetyltransferase